MTMGMGLLLIAIGAILRYAVNDSWDAVDLTVVGLILMVVGAVAFIVGAIYAFGYAAPERRRGAARTSATRPTSATEPSRRRAGYLAAPRLLEHVEHLRRLGADVVEPRRLARGPVRGRHCGRPLERREQGAVVAGSTRIPASGGTNSGGPPSVVAMTERSIAIPSSVA